MSEQVYRCTSCGGIYQAMIAECDCAVGVPFACQTMTVIDGDLRADVLALCEAADNLEIIPDDFKQDEAKELARMAKRISERLRKTNEQNNQKQKENKPES